jgi:hypothetical protein
MGKCLQFIHDDRFLLFASEADAALGGIPAGARLDHRGITFASAIDIGMATRPSGLRI